MINKYPPLPLHSSRESNNGSVSFQGENSYQKQKSRMRHKFISDYEQHPRDERNQRINENNLKLTGTYSNTSPLSVVLKKQEEKSKRNDDERLVDEDYKRGSIRRPASMTSTTTLVMNQKAKALRSEINSLDSEIQLL